MKRAKLLDSREIKGTYCYYDAYFPNKTSEQYNLYFNHCSRTKTEIKKALKEGKSVSLSESLLMLEEMKEGKVKEKDMACLFNLLKNYEFASKEDRENKANYKYPHNYGGYVEQQYLPDSIKDKVY